ncbi:hypothetical protein IFR05_016601 [Cadophora sp. M221]|nr:hypothetical protein IFR05_016601 [Cadophora sp. M221]
MSQTPTSKDRTPLPSEPPLTSTPPSYSGLSGALLLPPPPPTRKHSKWGASYVHSAQCDGCHTKKHRVMQRCLTCTLQYCKTCMPKARSNAHEYVEEELDWDLASATPQHRNHGSLRMMSMKGEKLPEKSRLGGRVGYGLGDEDDEFEKEDLVVVGSSSVSGRGRKANKGGMGCSSEKLIGENEKYQDPRQRQGQGYDDSRPTVFGGPPYQRPLIKDEDDGYGTPPNKRRRKSGGPSDSRFDEVEFTGQRFNDGPKQSASYAPSSSPFRSNIRQQSDNNRPQPPYRQPASTASSRLNQSRSRSQAQAFYEYKAQQEAQQEAQAQVQYQEISKGVIRRAKTMLGELSTFGDSLGAVTREREDEATLPARRQRFEEDCRDSWTHEPILRQLRAEGKEEEARDLYFAAREALYAARGLNGDE